MIEGRSGGSGRGTRRELWAHLTAVLQPADRTLYRVPTLDPRRPLISFPPPLPHPRTCLLATGKNSAYRVPTLGSRLPPISFPPPLPHPRNCLLATAKHSAGPERT